MRPKGIEKLQIKSQIKKFKETVQGFEIDTSKNNILQAQSWSLRIR